MSEIICQHFIICQHCGARFESSARENRFIRQCKVCPTTGHQKQGRDDVEIFGYLSVNTRIAMAKERARQYQK